MNQSACGHAPLFIIYKFCKRDFCLQPPGDPREHHPGDARQRTSSSKIFFSLQINLRQLIAEKLKKEDFVTIFLVHLHLDVVPEVLLMVGMNFLIHKSPILLSMIDLYRKIFFTTMFFVERHLDVVLEDPLVVGEKSLFYKTCR